MVIKVRNIIANVAKTNQLRNIKGNMMKQKERRYPKKEN
jgi:hypothetical protein